jgi:3-oxoadipate enol-lactonase
MHALIHGMKLGYTDEGQGIPLVFLHAFPLSKAMWQPQVRALVGSYRVITIDLRGHGESDVLLWNFTLDDYAHDVVGLLDYLNIREAVFIGLSMGGYILFPLWRGFSERVKILVFADTRAQADDEEGKEERQAMAQIAHRKGISAIVGMMIPKLLAPATIQHRPDIVEQIRQMILQAPTEGIIVDLMAMAARPDSTDLLTTISCPTLIIVGEHDVATPVAASTFMAQRISGSTVVTIPEAGHLSNFEQPSVFTEILQNFFRTHGV